MKYLQVPDDRLDLLDDSVLDRLEKTTGASVSIDAQSKSVSVQHEDSVAEMDTSEVIRAISRGFEPHTAMRLAQEQLVRFEEINVREKTRNAKEFRRQKGRIIGENGRTRELLEELSGADVRVYDNYVSIIGTVMEVKTVRMAVNRLTNGEPHAGVYAFLEEQHRSMNSLSAGFQMDKNRQ